VTKIRAALACTTALLAAGCATLDNGGLPAPGQAFRDCSVCPEMMVVPAGEFSMGASMQDTFDRTDLPPHTVKIARPFAIGKYEVMRREFEGFVSETGYRPEIGCSELVPSGYRSADPGPLGWRSPGFPQNERHPVVCVAFADAKAYVEWLARKTGKNYRLLTEAEWEYAARAGGERADPWSGAPGDACKHANVLDQSFSALGPLPERLRGYSVQHCNDGHPFTSPAGSYPANRLGLHDMLGNVWELVEDCWNDSHEGAPADGTARLQGHCSGRVARGTSWANADRLQRPSNRSTQRFAVGQTRRTGTVGFRVARGEAAPAVRAAVPAASAPRRTEASSGSSIRVLSMRPDGAASLKVGERITVEADVEYVAATNGQIALLTRPLRREGYDTVMHVLRVQQGEGRATLSIEFEVPRMDSITVHAYIVHEADEKTSIVDTRVFRIARP
jgi:formylglycine-generating enzyme required for sulfatase activity